MCYYLMVIWYNLFELSYHHVPHFSALVYDVSHCKL